MTSEKPAAGPNRRRFLAAVAAGSAASIAGVLGALGARFLWGERTAPSTTSVLVGPAASYDGTSPVEAQLAYTRADGYRSESRRERIFVVRQGESLIALSSTCTHLGCSVRWDGASRLFLCPCHGGKYRPDGTVAGGPPPAPLERLPIEIRGGQIYVRPLAAA
jgi:cytochrome b6-f complex iron-sulfur subunit